MRFFNTEGPVRPDKHYAIPPLDRVDIDGFLGLIRAERYFVLHAPRQTGKTSALIALRDLLNSGAAGLPAAPRRLPAERGAVRGVRHPRLPHPVEHRRGASTRLPEASAREVAVAAETKPSNCLTKQEHLRCR